MNIFGKLLFVEEHICLNFAYFLNHSFICEENHCYIYIYIYIYTGAPIIEMLNYSIYVMESVNNVYEVHVLHFSFFLIKNAFVL